MKEKEGKGRGRGEKWEGGKGEEKREEGRRRSSEIGRSSSELFFIQNSFIA